MTRARAAAGIAVVAALVSACTAATNPPSATERPSAALHRSSAVHHSSPVRPAATPATKPLDPAALQRLDQQAARDDAAGRRSAGARKVHTGKTRDWVVGSVGTYLVGRGIAPGTYRSAASPTGRCSWVRSRLTRAAVQVVLAHGAAPGPITVHIRASDGFFETRGCANWHRVG